MGLPIERPSAQKSLPRMLGGARIYVTKLVGNAGSWRNASASNATCAVITPRIEAAVFVNSRFFKAGMAAKGRFGGRRIDDRGRCFGDGHTSAGSDGGA